MMKKWGLLILAFGFLFTACKSDDDGFNEPNQEDQNRIDDEVIEIYLKEHYFDPERGKIKQFSTTDSLDDNYPTLFSQAQKLPSGVWIVKRADYIAEGAQVSNNKTDSILISYEQKIFTADYTDTTETIRPYKALQTVYSTLESGTPKWDPSFYYVNLANLNLNDNVKEEHFVVEGFVEGLKHFKATNSNGIDLYDFQGAIVVPSRMAFGRDFAFVGNTLDFTTFRNKTFVFNFELHKVVPRNQ